MQRFAISSWLLACSLALIPFAPSRAGMIYDGRIGISNITSAQRSDPDSARTLPSLAGMAFTLGSASTINEVQWTGIYISSNTPQAADDFTIEFYDFSGADPAIDPLFSFHVGTAVNRTDTGANFVSFDIYSYSAALPATNLDAGQYVLSIVNNTTADKNNNWYWSLGPNGTHSRFKRAAPTEAWQEIPEEKYHDFALFGPTNSAVPEPSSLILLGIGALGLIGYGSRRIMSLIFGKCQRRSLPVDT